VVTSPLASQQPHPATGARLPDAPATGTPLRESAPGGASLSWDLAVVGLGYVGLPLVVEAVRSGLRVVGLDLDPDRVARLNGGASYVDDVPDAVVADLLTRGFRASTSPDVLADADTVVVCVPTPLDDDHRPDLTAVTGATRMIADRLRPGALVVLESTTWVGTTDGVVLPILATPGLTERQRGSGATRRVPGQDFFLAFSPERIDPGNPLYGLRNTPKVVGGHTPACLARAVEFYGRFVDTVVPVQGTRVAEMAKLLENTYRHVNIALVNEMAVFCDELDVDLWAAIDAAGTKPFGFQAFRPGPGVGGHCIPVDPNYLSHSVRKLGYPFRFVELAQEVNERMPAYVAARAGRMLNAGRRSVNGSTILLLGVTYKADIADERETPALPLARRLLGLGADLRYLDPYVPAWAVDGTPCLRATDLEAAVSDADLTILLAPHRAFDLDAVARCARLVLDTRGVLAPSDRIERL
jgi:UDP-N-acetyl-D-glucosamine dehydrogenase